MLEEYLEAEVIRLLEARPDLEWHRCPKQAWRCRGTPGWPDLFVLGRRLILRELKGEDTRTRRHQLEFGEGLMAAGVSWGIWRPADLESGRIRAELDGIR